MCLTWSQTQKTVFVVSILEMNLVTAVDNLSVSIINYPDLWCSRYDNVIILRRDRQALFTRSKHMFDFIMTTNVETSTDAVLL